MKYFEVSFASKVKYFAVSFASKMKYIEVSFASAESWEKNWDVSLCERTIF